jgi:hypothetical protein
VATRLLDIAPARLRLQKLARANGASPSDVVRWLGAVQAQDYAGARWALGLRVKGATDEDVSRAFDKGDILRTHMLRPTWHFVVPEDIRWMQRLTAPRVHVGNGSYYRKLGLDDRLFARSRTVFERALSGGALLTRTELASALARAGVVADGQRLAYLVMHAELEQVICSGPRRGKQFTYALLEERVPRAPALGRDEALAELTRRYFASHGPATLRDYVWWSGLAVREATRGLDLAGSALACDTLNDLTYWCVEGAVSRSMQARTGSTTGAFLLPNYDEYLIAYRDRGPAVSSRTGSTPQPNPFPHHLVLNGRVVGSWRRTDRARTVKLEIAHRGRLTTEHAAAVRIAADRYAQFVEREIVVSFVEH